MMIDFEDKMPAKPLSWRSRVAIVVLVILQLGGCVSNFSWVLGTLGLK